MDKCKYEIRQIDAWGSEEGWTWNNSIKLGEFTTAAEDHKRAFLNALKRLGITCKRGSCKVECDGDIYELQNRKTGEPLIAAIPAL